MGFLRKLFIVFFILIFSFSQKANAYIAKVEISTGLASDKLNEKIEKINKGENITLKQGVKAKILVGNEDFVNVRAPAEFSFDIKNGTRVINIKKGEFVFYVMPRLEGRKSPFIINAKDKKIKIHTGKAFLSIKDDLQEFVMLENIALFSKEKEQKLLTKGEKINFLKNQITKIDEKYAKQKTDEISPEYDALKEAIVSFSKRDVKTAKKKFEKLKKAFPYNSGSAFYLGQINLDEGKVSKAIDHWQLYEKLDPKGAKENEIPKHLTALIGEQLNEQIKQALKNEEKISSLPPEPNSVAVVPFRNKGSDKYKTLSKGLAALLISDLSKVPGIKVLERQKLHKIIDEMSMAKSGLLNEDDAIRAGRLMKAEKIVLGDYSVEE